MDTEKARSYYKSLHNYVGPFISIFGIYVAWICIHYASPRVYVSYCVPATVIGFIYSPFLAQSPHCIALRWAISKSGESIYNMFGISWNFVYTFYIDNIYKSLLTSYI